MVTWKHSQILRTIPCLIAVCLISLPAQAKYSGGTGEPNDPYQIATAADLIALGETPKDYDKHFILTADIDLDPNLPGRKVFDRAVIAPDANNMNWWFDGTPFTGFFDGKRHTISHLTIQGGSSLGLFGCVYCPAEVRNVGVVDVNITASGDNVGGLVGRNGDGWTQAGVVTNCYSSGVVTSDANYVGGLVGWNYDGGGIARCYSTAGVSGNECVGGLVGGNGGAVTDCYSTGAVTGDSYVAGLVGSNWLGVVTHCYSGGAVSGTGVVGGLVGGRWRLLGGDCWNGPGITDQSFWDTQASGQAESSRSGGVGLTTAQMQDMKTYLDAGWDFVDEVRNGTHQVWQMPGGGGYPVLSVFNGYAPPQLRGSGTPDDPYLISDALELGAMVHYSPNASYRLAASIDLSGIHWGTPVIPWFAGTFDGNDLTIRHLVVSGQSHIGLFGRLTYGAEIKNLGVVDVNATDSGGRYTAGYPYTPGYLGGLVGYNEGNVTHCYTAGVVTGTEGTGVVGGLVGYNGGLLTQCRTRAVVSGATGEYACTGGLVGINSSWNIQGGSVINCCSAGVVSGSPYDSGGLVGRNMGGTVARSYSSAEVNGHYYVGGLVGGNSGVVTACFWDTQTSGQATSAGGTGKTTTEMQTASTFLDAGWDFVGETAHGTEDIWWIDEGKDYPRLSWETK